MKRNRIPLLPLFFMVALFFPHLKSKAEAGPEPFPFSAFAAVGGSHPFPLPIESILNNPAIFKKQVARNTIQAVGRRETGAAHFVVHFRKEQLHGEWQSFFDGDQPCDSGRFEKGLPDGEWKTWYANGQLKTVRHYSAEKYHFIKADVLRNHPKFQRFAVTKLAAKNPAPYFRPHYESDVAASGYRSMLQRIQYNTSGDGGSYLAPYGACLHHGLYINYAANGAVKDSGHYTHGLKHGLWKEAVAETAQHAFGFYHHGVRQGQWKYYHEDGSLIYSELYNATGKKKEWHYFKK